MKIIGIGNALLDVLFCMENDDTLHVLGLQKGAMDIIDESKMVEIQKLEKHLSSSVAPGGSVCNSMRALARLGANTGYIGKIGNDRPGEVYNEEITKAGVRPFLVKKSGMSGCSTVLISPDGERTMATYLGLAATLAEDEIADDVLQQYDCVYIEGYLISNEKLFLPILRRAKNLGLKIALDLSNFNIVNGFKTLLKTVIPEYVDILFSNESEAEAYTGLVADKAIVEILKEVEISVVTIGKRGALAGNKDRIVHEPALSASVLDTTGAGDNFAAGFLYGYANGVSIEQSAQIGALLAGHVIEVMGAQIENAQWNDINHKICEILRK
ncbi:MAG: adenosine kinase [Tannerella sp.]|jgi:sugar/nucleoside kinase (ribokinase family)|nr:adenosine kinase [Tannerella sp.]